MGSPLQEEQLNLLTPDAPQFKPKGWTALHLLANRPDSWGRRGELAQLLLNKRADPMRLTARSATPLHTAAGTSNFCVAQVLLDHRDTQVNAKNKDNKHPWDCVSNATMRKLLERYGGAESDNKTGGSSRDEPNARSRFGRPSQKRMERAQNWQSGRR